MNFDYPLVQLHFYLSLISARWPFSGVRLESNSITKIITRSELCLIKYPKGNCHVTQDVAEASSRRGLLL